MRLEYYASGVGNFGDDLNPWLWPKIFPGLFERGDDGLHFIGIGSILDDRYSSIPGLKIVFGTGARSRATIPKIDHTWGIRFVRGPLTALSLGLPASSAVCDSALALALLRRPERPRRGVCFMPHFRTAALLPWERITELANVRLIDPRWPVERVLESLEECDRLITEAMHGAIVADLLRIPWTRVTCHSHLIEKPAVSEFKWSDWAQSLKIDDTPHPLPKLYSVRGSQSLQFLKRSANLLRGIPIIAAIRRIAGSASFRLSGSKQLLTRLAQLEEHVSRFRSEYHHRSDQSGFQVSNGVRSPQA
jgi:succinoglycan biosynthesis protein ExoV